MGLVPYVTPTQKCPDPKTTNPSQEGGGDALYKCNCIKPGVWVPQCHQVPTGMMGCRQHPSTTSPRSLDASRASHHSILLPLRPPSPRGCSGPSNPGCTG